MLEKLPLPEAHDGATWFAEGTGQLPSKHRHEELEINLITQGTARYLMDNGSYRLESGSLIWLFPGQNHLLVDKSRDFRMWILVFRPRLLRRVCREPSRRVLLEQAPDGDFLRQLPGAPVRRLARRFAEIHGQQKDAALFNAGLAYGLLEAWEAFQRAGQPIVGEDVHPAVSRAAQLLRAAPDNTDLSALAKQAGLSRTRLSELFRAQTGVSLVDFRHRLRLERFADLRAAAPEKTLLSHALEAGFGSYQQFHRIFKRHVGRSPAR